MRAKPDIRTCTLLALAFLTACQSGKTEPPGGHIATVEQGVDAYRLDALGLGLDDHRLQVIDMAMDVAIGKQADEMHHARFSIDAGFRSGDDLLPRLTLPNGAGSNGVGNQRRVV